MVSRRVDASMDLLRQVQRDAVEPEYLSRPARGDGPRPRTVGALGVALVTTLLTMAAVQTSRQAPAAADERADLVAQIRAAQDAQDRSRASVAALNAQILQLQGGQSSTSTSALNRLTAVAGASPVTGPGVVVQADDAHAEQAPQVSDQDIRQLVNGLWAAGAEAIAVNGHRVTARTAIRQAGSAITVDYSSLTRPYRVEAIGNPARLGGDFAASPGGRWWAFLRSNYGISYEVTTSSRIELPGDAALTTHTAQTPR